MLFITRAKNETINIGNTRVMIVDVRGSIVRLGIRGTPSTAIYRDEVYQEIMADMKQGAPSPKLRPTGNGMLVLARRPGETIVLVDTGLGELGWREPNTVQVAEIRGTRARLGIVADRSVSISRQ